MVPLGAALIIQLRRHHVPFSDAAGTATAGIVTMVPEGLILLTSLTFAVAAVRLTRQGMLVQYLNSVESLANVDTVCLDKTGTLTDGGLVLHSVSRWTARIRGRGAHPARTLRGSAASRNATLEAIADALPATAVQADAGGAVLVALEVERARAQAEDGWLVLGAPDVLAPGDLPGAAEHEAAGRRVLVFGRADDVEPPVDGASSGHAPRSQPLAPGRARGTTAGGRALTRSRIFEKRAVSAEGDVRRLADDRRRDRRGRRRAGRRRRCWDGRRSALRSGRPGAVVGAQRDVFARLTPDHKRALVEALTAVGRLRGDDRRRRQRRAGDEDRPAGDRAGQRQPARQERRRRGARHRPLRRHPGARSARAARSSATCSASPSCSSPSRCSPPS